METATEITDTAKLVATTTTKATRRKSRIRIRKPSKYLIYCVLNCFDCFYFFLQCSFMVI